MYADNIYKHSGRISLIGIPVTLLVGSLIGIVVGALYAALIYYNPFIFFNIVAIFVFGLLAGGGAGAGMRAGDVRNTFVLILLTLAVTTVALAASWIVWVRLMSGEWIFNSDLILLTLKLFSSTGVWTFSDWTPQGGELYFLWSLEALIVYGSALVMTYHAIAVTPFCEQSGNWTEIRESKTNFAGIDVTKVVNELKQRPGQVTELLKQPVETATNFIRFHLGTTEESTLRTLSIETVDVKIKDGKPEEKTKVVLRNLVIDPHTFEVVDTACGPAES